MRITAQCSLREVAFIVCTTLDRVGITAVLTGGSAATIWSEEEYQSRDCDFIITFSKHNATGMEALRRLGYTESGQIYRHPESIFTVEFPRGPLSIGDELINSWETLRMDNLLLHILSPTDSCCDRLAAFYHWNDFSSISVAVAIARNSVVDMERVERWSEKEGARDKFEQFERALNSGG